MTAAGIAFMILSWGGIFCLCFFCFYFIFREHAAKHLVAPLEIDAEGEHDANE